MFPKFDRQEDEAVRYPSLGRILRRKRDGLCCNSDALGGQLGNFEDKASSSLLSFRDSSKNESEFPIYCQLSADIFS